MAKRDTITVIVWCRVYTVKDVLGLLEAFLPSYTASVTQFFGRTSRNAGQDKTFSNNRVKRKA